MSVDFQERLVLITGATGLIGAEIALKLVQSGWIVRALVRPKRNENPVDRLYERLRQSPAAKTVDFTKIRPVVGDVTQEGLSLPEGDDWIPAAVIHCAADTSFLERPLNDHPNVLGADRVIEFVKKKSQKTKLILLSSASVNLGHRGAVIFEDTPNAGYQNVYTLSKRLAEQNLRESGVSGYVLRPSIVLGAGIDNRAMARSLLWVIFMLSELGAFPVDPDARLDMVPVNFVAEATVKLLNKSELSCSCYHISAGIHASVTCREIIESLHNVIPSLKHAECLGASSWPKSFYADARARRMIRAIDYYLPFMNADVIYSNERLQAELDGDFSGCRKATEYLPDLVRQVSLLDAYEESYRP